MVKVSPTVQKLKQPDPELALKPRTISVGLQAPLDRITDVGGHVLEVGQPVRIARHAIPVILDSEVVFAVLAPRVMVMVFACASIEFSTNSAIAFKGLLCESAMMRIAFQSSPILSLP